MASTYGAGVYGPSYAGRFVRPENLRNPMLKRRGIFRRWYAVEDVTRFLTWVAADLERRQEYEHGLLSALQQLRDENHNVKLSLQQWQSERAREAMQRADS